MKTYTQEQLNEVLRLHRLWLDRGKEGVRANLSGANLSKANLSGAYLPHANLTYANLSSANISDANLSRANLTYATVTREQFNNHFIVPEYGSFIGFKKLNENKIAVLKIPANAKRTNSTGRKCRAEFAKVLKIYDLDKKAYVHDGIAMHNSMVYTSGMIVRPDSYNDDFREECTNGIHFFITKKEAIDHLVDELRKDEGYYYSWKSSIAMAVFDAIQNNLRNKNLLDCCNQGADTFLTGLMYRIEDELEEQLLPKGNSRRDYDCFE